MSEHTPTPWTFQRAPKPTDGQYDCAIAAVIDGERHIVAETFGRVASNVFPNSEANAAFIVKAVNSHDLLVQAMTSAKRLIGAVNDTATAAVKESNINMAWHILDDALASIKERA
jgi:hypothetical protein